MTEPEIVELVYSPKIRGYLKRKFRPVYDEYEPYVAEWILELLSKYNDLSYTGEIMEVNNYLMQQLEFKFLNKLRTDSNVKLSQVTEDISENEIVVYDKHGIERSSLSGLIDSFVDSKPKHGNTKCDIAGLLKSYFKLINPSLKAYEIDTLYGVSREYRRQVKNQFKGFVLNRSDRKDIVLSILKHGLNEV